ncbi:MAG: lytic transglycosylase domain-containing protein [Selenomonadaceae bacterium]|nr:lytic transglycosylase domain-containing protein [Selenomonadaceae bacterium]
MTKKFLAICAALVAVYFLISVPTIQKKFLYPFPYRSTVENYSSRWKVDKFLAVAVMKVESNFSEAAQSQSGAVGLMQIMPETAAWIAYQLGETPEEVVDDIKNLHNPETNIRYGTWYLAELEDEFKGNDVLALAAYNAGRGNVHEWIKENNWSENFSDVDKIPYAETRDYVKCVLHCREKYSELYGTNEFISTPIALHELRFARLKNLSL